MTRAQRDIAALPPDTPKDAVMMSPLVLAVQLYLAAPNDERRALAISILDRDVKKFAAVKESAEQVKMLYDAAALEHAKLGDFDGARKLLALADQPSGAPPTTNPMVQMVAGWGDESRAEAYLLMGDTAGFDRVKSTVRMLPVVADDLRSMGFVKEANIAAEAAKTAPPLFGPAPKIPGTSAGWDRVESARDLARDGKYDDAMKVAATADDNLPADAAGHHTDPGRYAFDAYAEIAGAAEKDHDPVHFDAAKAAALAVLQKHPTTSNEMMAFVQTCAAAKDHPAFETAANSYLEQVRRERSSAVNRTTALQVVARLYSDMGNRAEAVATADEAEKQLSTARKELSATDEDKDRHLRQMAEDYLWIAAARARLGDVAGVNRDTELSKQVTTLEGGYWDEEWAEVIHGYLKAGMIDEAVAALPLARWDDEYGGLHADVARAMAHAGRWDDAWNMAAKIPSINRPRVEYLFAVMEVAAHREGDLSGRIGGLKTPYDKALVELAAGQAMTGKTYQESFRMFKEKT